MNLLNAYSAQRDNKEIMFISGMVPAYVMVTYTPLMIRQHTSYNAQEILYIPK
jgi:hypothetical protein